ncbi:DUF1540 domain-containing protein [Heliorestis convoluta]|uniref:DUF1540 domain-containing protein n=1 Tax=Heliorestis convoluta TaxID=356322 RepID=A0A5Q2N825_9FIRM|nr:DUF1540 domain-containing protein [Heliorestis convoluta]QGG48645.1 hypothetical protein FTV88_2552 [Heliorestis convoluta]
MSMIKCNVEECHYNQSEFCQASTIHVKSRVPDHMTSISDDTACETFIPKTTKK